MAGLALPRASSRLRRGRDQQAQYQVNLPPNLHPASLPSCQSAPAMDLVPDLAQGMAALAAAVRHQQALPDRPQYAPGLRQAALRGSTSEVGAAAVAGDRGCMARWVLHVWGRCVTDSTMRGHVAHRRQHTCCLLRLRHPLTWAPSPQPLLTPELPLPLPAASTPPRACSTPACWPSA